MKQTNDDKLQTFTRTDLTKSMQKCAASKTVQQKKKEKQLFLELWLFKTLLQT